MKRIIVNLYLIFANVLNVLLLSHSYPINIGPNSIHKFGNYNNGNVCLLNYNNVYSTFYKWSKDKEEYHDKIIKDTIWLNKNRFSSPNIIIGVYNKDGDLNYICLLRRVGDGRFKLLNIFANPYNGIDDDIMLFENILGFCNDNKYSLNMEKLKVIDNSKYYLTYLYAYNGS
jgi:hypothetical protein